jgi:hypothetical protein
MDDEFFVGWEEVEARRKVSRPTHMCWGASTLELDRLEADGRM